MTSIDFYSNVENKLALVSELVQKAINQHRKVTVYVEDEDTATSVSHHLWAHEGSAFVANVLANDALASVTPALIAWQAETILQDDLLINMQVTHPVFFSRFKQLVEVVSLEEQDKADARKRYSYYRDRGYEIKHVDMFKNSI